MAFFKDPDGQPLAIMAQTQSDPPVRMGQRAAQIPPSTEMTAPVT
jgi:hypothetical protein